MRDRQSWLAARKHGLGGSDIAAICGLSKWRGPLEVYADKRGLVEDSPTTEIMEWGNRLEAVVAEKYAESLPKECKLITAEEYGFSDTGLHTHPDHEWMHGTPDRIVMAWDDFEPWGLEIKTTHSSRGGEWGEQGTDQIPSYYRCQVAWYQAIFDLDRWDVAVLIGGQQYRTYTVKRDMALETRLIEIGRRFWTEHVLAGVPPEPTATSNETMQALFPHNEGTTATATAEVDAVGCELGRLRAQEAQIAEDRAALENRIKAAIGENDGVGGRGWRATWKAPKPSTKTDWEGVARNIAQSMGDEGVALFDRIRTAHTTQAQGSRRFLFKTEEE